MTLPLLIFAALFLTACDHVLIEERVMYEDGVPVPKAKVIQYTDGYTGVTQTDVNGRWSIYVPADTVINLCIVDPKTGNKCCFEEDALLTPSLTGGNEMVRI